MELFLSNYNYYCKINPRYTFINNTLTGAVDFIENYIWDLFIDSKYNEIDNVIINKLIDRGYLYKNPNKEKKILNELYRNYIKKASSRPIRFVFCPTYQCNLNCIYCFEKDLIYNSNKYMNISILEDSLKAVKEISKNNLGKIESVELFGGEPLLLKTKILIKRILEFAYEYDSTITIVTNGVHAKDYIDILKPIKKNIEMLQITIDGPPEIHNKRRCYHSGKGSFNEISESIDKLLVNEINTNVRINIDNTNIYYLPQLYEYIIKKNWFQYKHFSIRPSIVTDHNSIEYNDVIIPEEKLLEKLVDIYNTYPVLEELFGFFLFKPLRHIVQIMDGAPNVSPKFFNCESNLLELNIFCPDGYIYVCPESIGNPYFSIGKFSPSLVFDKKKKNMWTQKTILNIEKCKNCKFSPICGGGCTYSSFLVHDGCIPVCERYQEILDTFFKLRGEKILKKFIDK